MIKVEARVRMQEHTNATLREMPYRVKEVYATLQGEGYHAGRAAVFLRFSGCNLWSGREQDRAKAVCQFCDTNFWGTDGPGGGTFDSAEALADAVRHCWDAMTAGGDAASGDALQKNAAHADARPMVVCTGGEPLLQLDAPLITALHAHRFEVAIETNGTRPLPTMPAHVPGVDWVCVSPKANAPLVLTQGDELKLVYPQPTLLPDQVQHLRFTHRYLQPMDGPHAQLHTEQTLQYIRQHPQWRLSLQTHKLLGIP